MTKFAHDKKLEPTEVAGMPLRAPELPEKPVVRYGFAHFEEALGEILSARLFNLPGKAHTRELQLIQSVVSGLSPEQYISTRLPVDERTMFEGYAEFRAGVIRELSTSKISLERVGQYLDALRPNESNLHEYFRTGQCDAVFDEQQVLIKTLGLMRNDPVTIALLERAFAGFHERQTEMRAVTLWALVMLDDEQADRILNDSSLKKFHPLVPRFLSRKAEQYIPVD